MTNIISGRIRYIDNTNRIIGLKVGKRIKFYYMQRSLYRKMSRYLYKERFVQFTTKNQTTYYKHYKVKTIHHFTKIMALRYRKNIIYYDYNKVKSGLKELFNNLEYKLFLDLELSMHPYYKDKNFIQEIIQVGMILEDKEGNIVYEYEDNIKPTRHKKLTKRTLKFLQLNQNDVDNGVDYNSFYNKFKKIIHQYNPAIIVWGKNDFLSLKRSYNINDKPSLRLKTRYINLLKLHKNYFHLKNDIGLFNALDLYKEHDESQNHNALEDAKVTRKIFKGFKKVLNKEITIDTSNYK
ncbi:MAG: hypothetical protein K9L74_04295 [Candidatus Izimaplasma sp.]|nr:hypothetical protein [Candidatus Izimaplasma bacterium]